MAQIDTPTANSDAATGLLFMTTAMLVVPIIDAIAKYLAGTIPPVEIAWLRFVVSSSLLVPFVIWRDGGFAALRLPHLHLHFLRGAGIAGATAFFFAALQYMPIANVAAIFFVEPLILTLFSAIFLGDRIGWRRILAVLVGFGGALVIIRPSFAVLGATALLPLGAAVCFAGYMTITKRLSNAADPWTLQALANLSGFVVLGIVVIIGLVAIFCHTLIIFALRRVSASVVAPFQYLEIIGATLWGYVFFSEFPDALTWLGVAIIVSSGIFVFYREQRVGS
jgi:S-adenosylmethionine uptake transporter